MANFTGTASNDLITPKQVSAGVTRDPANARPSAANDGVSAGVGNDTVQSAGGNDFVNGEDGNDLLDGGTESDQLNGGAGNDTLIGGAGNDGMNGGDGADTYQFGKNWGQDFINPSSTVGRDVIEFLDNVNRDKVTFRIENNDLIITQGLNTIFVNDQYAAGGGNSSPVKEIRFGTGPALDISRPDAAWLNRVGSNVLGDSMTGSIFKDTLDGRGGNDNIFGGDENDTLTGGRGDDFVSGGLGNDLYRFEPGFGRDSLSEGFASGKDVIQFLEGLTFADLDITVQGTSLVIERGSLNRIVLQNQFSSGQAGAALFETLRFDSGPDVDIRRVDDDWLVRSGNALGERFDGSIFKDTIDGGGGNDTISTSDGNDRITGGRGDDQLFGGAGNDTYVFESKWGLDTIGESFNAGRDVVLFGPGVRPQDIDFRVEGTSLILSQGGSAITLSSQFSSGVGINALVESLVFDDGTTIKLTKPEAEWLVQKGRAAAETFNGSVFGDTIDGGGGNDFLSGGSDGKDELIGNSGNDTIFGGLDRDTLTGGSGLDSMAGGDGNDLIDGGGDADTIRGEIGNDTILGGAGADTIDGGDGRNVIDGGGGNDSLTSGVGGETFVFRQGDGNDVIIGFQAARDDLQFLAFTNKYDTAAEVLADASQRGDDVVFSLDIGGDRVLQLTLIGVDLDRLSSDNIIF